MNETRGPGYKRKPAGKATAKSAGPIAAKPETPAAPAPEPAPAKSAPLEVIAEAIEAAPPAFDPPASKKPVSKKNEAAAALVAEPAEPAAPLAGIAPAPAPADIAPPAAPEAAAVPEAEPVPTVAADAPIVAQPKPDPVAALKPMPAIAKGMFNMATTFDAVTSPAAATEKVKAMFGGMNDRAKTAMEKSAKFGEELTELTKGNVEALVASSKVAAKGAESMAQEAAEYGKKNFESATAMFKSFASAKTPTELFQLQSDYAKSSFDSAVAEASKLSEAWVKLAGEVVQPISNRYAVAAEKLKAAAL